MEFTPKDFSGILKGKTPENTTLDELIQTADKVMKQYFMYALWTHPIGMVIDAAVEYFSQLDGAEYKIDGGIMIMGPPPIPGMMEGIPVIVPIQLRAPERCIGFLFEGQIMRGYKFTFERRVKGKSGLEACMGRDFDSGHFGITINYGNPAGNIMRKVVQEGTHPEMQEKVRAFLAKAEDMGIVLRDMTPYEGLQWLDYMVNTVFYDPHLEKANAELRAEVAERRAAMH